MKNTGNSIAKICHLYEVIKVPSTLNNYYGASTGQIADDLQNLSLINVLIGPNNCGKSRLLRALFNSSSLTYENSIFTVIFQQNLNIVKEAIKSRLEDKGKHSDVHKLVSICDTGLKKSGMHGSMSALNAYIDKYFSKHSDRNGLNKEYSEITRKLENLYPVYIPTLRGFRGSGYTSTTVDDYFKNQGRLQNRSSVGNADSNRAENNEIFSGLNVNETIFQYQHSSLKERNAVRDFQQYLSKQFFNSEPVELITRRPAGISRFSGVSDKKSGLYIKIGDEQEYPIHQLGDGIQHIIIMTLPMFLHRDRDLLLFIEEPELYMHPGMLRQFIDSISTIPCNGTRQVFVTTHSHHFLDMTLDHDRISVYKLRKVLNENEVGDEKEAKFEIRNVSNEDFSLLNELGVRNSSVFLSNCTIWVEGITDRLYIGKYLACLQGKLLDEGLIKQKFVQDIHYAFVEYGGGNITHFFDCSDREDECMQPKNLCGELMLVSDSDYGKDERHEKLKASLGDRYYKIESREMECLLSASVIKGVLDEYSGLEDGIATAEINEVEYQGMPGDKDAKKFGAYLESLFEDVTKAKPSGIANPYQASSGTVKDKVKFCKKAVRLTGSWDDMSDQAKLLAKAVFDFVLSKNEGLDICEAGYEKGVQLLMKGIGKTKTVAVDVDDR
ncbi:hypothetical protein KS4_36260 [Poriferisphaera corsica]|uniref:Endonuclease GajA/Old nuclease/RecF-like AAA domain-containing protein n=1 Tax=Poriferisphaera corsica TaxID=2528020 RepID=A0A517YZE6_9BACT|nr:ATP-binding protein [Poriferisphaera corsica]QDU35543.1 hypothetical protein KS4_36260 [Poriferisphaera corsica]